MLSGKLYEKGVKLLRLAAVIQYTLPGVPSLYYGDEAGMQGYKDPFNRGCYPWGSENHDLIKFYQTLGKIRKESDCLREGSYFTVSEMLSCLAFERQSEKDALLVIVNRNPHPITYDLPPKWHNSRELFRSLDVAQSVELDALDAVILKKEFDS